MHTSIASATIALRARSGADKHNRRAKSARRGSIGSAYTDGCSEQTMCLKFELVNTQKRCYREAPIHYMICCQWLGVIAKELRS